MGKFESWKESVADVLESIGMLLLITIVLTAVVFTLSFVCWSAFPSGSTEGNESYVVEVGGK